jgi:hypothetical protein
LFSYCCFFSHLHNKIFVLSLSAFFSNIELVKQKREFLFFVIIIILAVIEFDK